MTDSFIPLLSFSFFLHFSIASIRRPILVVLNTWAAGGVKTSRFPCPSEPWHTYSRRIYSGERCNIGDTSDTKLKEQNAAPQPHGFYGE